MTIETLLRTALCKNIDPQSIHTYRSPLKESDLAVPRLAAVLVMLMQHQGVWSVLLTQRAANLSHHPGQISFVGGIVDSEDESTQNTALREAEEEVGMPQSAAAVLGTLHRHLVAQRFLVTPFVALVSPFDIQPQVSEVENVFFLPLSFLLDDANCLLDHRDDNYKGYQLHYQHYRIWGGTAAILLDLKSIIRNHDQIYHYFLRP